ncbi:MAG TPA: hypothetical protein VGJ26_12575 [Pirellulales bacterium]
MRQNLLRALLALGLLGASAHAAGLIKKTTNPQKKLSAKTNSAVQVTLKQQLEKGLKLRRPIEFQFVDRVVKMVEDGKLSIDTVNKAFAWSRERNSFRPYVYFEQSLIELAKRDGVEIKGELISGPNDANVLTPANLTKPLPKEKVTPQPAKKKSDFFRFFMRGS